MASVDPRAERPEGRVIPLYTLDTHIEARRLGAALLDLLVLSLVVIWVNDVFGVTGEQGEAPLRNVIGFTYLTTATTVGPVGIVLVAIVVYSAQEALFGATWGKLVAGLRVVDLEGRRPLLKAVLARNVLRIVDYFPFIYGLGAVAVMTSPRRQRLGDRLAGTLVVRVESAPLAYLPLRALRRRLLALALGSALVAALCLAFSYYGRPPLVIQGLVNTGVLFADRGPNPYSLGAPTWGAGTVTYHAHYDSPSGGGQRCQGSIALRWDGFFGIKGGWTLASDGVVCR